MLYRAIGVMSGSSLDGLDVVFAELQERADTWSYEIKCAACLEYDTTWEKRLKEAVYLPALDYQLLHTDYGSYIGRSVNEFIEVNKLQHKVNLVCSHGHTTFHLPEKKMTHQLGDGAAIAAETKLPTVTDLRSLDVAFGGQGAPIVPLGEKLLFHDYHYFLNLGGIANLSVHTDDSVIAFDVCAANKVLNLLANQGGVAYDDKGEIASKGNINIDMFEKLNSLEYFKLPYPKSLANSFGTDIIFPIIQSFETGTENALATFVDHICIQIKSALQPFQKDELQSLFVTGGGAFNSYLIERLQEHILELNFKVHIPEEEVIQYKEALIMALLGVLRWREQNTVLASVTGAERDSIGGALWLGTDA